MVEIDFSAYHPHMMFAEKGFPYPDIKDFYTLEGVAIERATLKQIFNAAVNHAGKKKPRKIAIPKGWKYQDIVDLFRDAYPEIEAFIGTGYGIKLQYKDACVAEHILLQLMEKNIVALPVHDSFIVPEQHKAVLENVMKEAYTAVMKKPPPHCDLARIAPANKAENIRLAIANNSEQHQAYLNRLKFWNAYQSSLRA